MGTGREIWVADDDARMRTSLAELLESVGYATRTFGSGVDLLAAIGTQTPGCLILDLRLGAESGLRLQATLTERRIEAPVIFISGHADVPVSVRAMKAGALDFLQKPFREQDLLDAVEQALHQSTQRRAQQDSVREIEARYGTLSPRERDVMSRVIAGRLNKQVAAELGVSEVTVKANRASVLRKMKAGSLAELVRLGGLLNLSGPEA